MTSCRSLGRRAVVLLAVGTALSACADRPIPGAEDASPSRSVRAPSPTTSTGPAIGPPASVEEALSRFQGYPALHGTLVYQAGSHDEIRYEMWIDEPSLWISIVGATELGPWVSDGESSNMTEPHAHVGALMVTDPREMFRCERFHVVGHEEVVGRPATAISCRSTSDDGETTLWLDDATGLILAGESDDEGASWTFIELEIDPVFPEGIFDLDPDPVELWFEVPSGPALGPGDEAVDRALDVFAGFPVLHGSMVVHPDDGQGEDDRLEMYVREPQVRIDVVIPGTSYPWVGTTEDEPPDPHAMAMWAPDPRLILPQCVAPEVLVQQDVLGRPTTGISCPTEWNDALVLWIDDESGLIVQGYWEREGGVGWFGFTDLEIDPDVSADVFEVATVVPSWL